MPRTLAQNAQYIAETIKPAIKSAIEAQGVTVPSTDSFLDYADRIGEIEGGGSGYQLKDLPTGSIATVTDAAELPLNALKVSVEAWQEGTGDPSPSNIRPIHGWDTGEIRVCDDIQSPTQTETTTIDFPQTIYGAEWDVINGELGLKITDGFYESYNGETLPGIWMSDRDVYQEGTTPTIGAQVKYRLATPTYITLTGLSIRLLEGTNNLYADCGEVIEGEYFSGDNQLYANGIIFAGEGDSGIGSYRKIDTLPTDLLNASAMTCEVCARFDSFVNLSSGPYARIITFGDDNQTGRFGVIGVAYDGSSSYDLCVWDDTIDLSSGLYEWTPTDTHTVAVVKTTAGAIKIYVDGVLKYTGSSALTITNTLIDYICQRSRYNASYDTQRQINGEVYAWRIYGKELSASQINANFLVDKINYID